MNHVLANSGTFAQSTITSPSLSYLKGGTWKSFSNQAKTTMDGIKIRTPSTNGVYYLEYRTWNEGKSDYYPYVNSKDDDYAGSPGKPIQRLQIQAYRGDGTKLTSGIVVMYRAFVENKWLPWVSNADPQWMQAVQKKHNLGGTLDTAGSYAGLPGKNIAGIEIRVYAEGSMGDFSGGENEASMSYLVDSDWSTFNKSALASHIDGIKIQTDSNKDYYLSYKTQNEGKSDYYPAVSSLDNDYAGSPRKPIQKLNIRVLNRAGVSLTSGVIVMYRAFVENKWLPWVSNADPEWMRNVQSKYSLGGTLDTSSAYAGIEGKNISGIEIRIFEDNSANSGSGSFSGDEISISSRYMVDNTSNWKSFTGSVKSSHIDGVELKTSGQPFYFLYKTWNEGQPYYYPAVKSTDSDYAGSPGKPIQKLNIEVYSNDGTELTSGVVVMYRAYVDGRWLPWVSNADPEWMESVQAQYNLGGTLDVNGYCAGITGKNISGLEIRVFSGSTASIPGENLPGTETKSNLQYLIGSTWKSFTGKVTASHIDGLKIQTSSSKSYYLLYKTRNEGKDDYYPPISSRENDYAGSPNKPIQRLNIEVYRNDGVKLTTGIVVMYRAYVGGKWLPWVSNADPEWMRSVQAKYDLGGILDTSAYYAGLPGKNIGGVEIRIFEENNTQIPPQKPTGKSKIIDVDFISQVGKYPTGCESVSAVMALRHIGYTTSVERFIDCLPKSEPPFDPNISFGGDPYSTHGYGCYAPVIAQTLLKVLDTRKYEAKVLSKKSLEVLCKEYIDKDIPVIFWATMFMKPPYVGDTWKYKGKQIEWIAPEHCLLLVGYDDSHYIFNDPLVNKQTYYSKESVEAAYLGLHQQAVVIVNQPSICKPTDEEIGKKRKERFLEILKLLHVPTGKAEELEWGFYFSKANEVVSTGKIGVSPNDINYSCALGLTSQIEFGGDFVSLHVENGKISMNSAVSNQVSSICASVGLENAVTSFTPLALTIGKGQISIGAKSVLDSSGNFVFKTCYRISTTLDFSSGYSETFYMTVEFWRDEDQPPVPPQPQWELDYPYEFSLDSQQKVNQDALNTAAACLAMAITTVFIVEMFLDLLVMFAPLFV